MSPAIVFWTIFLHTIQFLSKTESKPCEECIEYDEQMEGDTHKIIQSYSQCKYPCECPLPPACAPGVPVIRDGCGCCWSCAAQENNLCDTRKLCDAEKNLSCRYKHSTDRSGTCVALKSIECSVENRTFADGSTFLLDCRTQCTCKGGSYACVSLCPGEMVSPSGECKSPRLVALDGACCREWMCQTKPDIQQPQKCETQAGEWSDCSAHPCGMGVSKRWFIDAQRCQIEVQSRLCQMRPCNRMSFQEEQLIEKIVRGSKRHHVRKNHLCKATQRYQTAVHLKVGSCISEKKYRPKMCADCSSFTITAKKSFFHPNNSNKGDSRNKKCCKIHSSTTIEVEFVCPLHAVPELLKPDPRRWTVEDLRKGSKSKQNHAEDSTERSESNSNEPRNGLQYDQNNADDPGNRLKYYNRPDDLRSTSSDPIKLIDIMRTMDEGQPMVPEDAWSPTPSQSSKKLKEFTLNEQIKELGILGSMAESGILAEDYTTTNLRELIAVKNDNHEVITHKIEWIIRCSCDEVCGKVT